MNDLWKRVGDRSVESFGVAVSAGSAEALAAFVGELSKWGRKMNLVADVGEEEVAWRHVFDSLAVAAVVADGEVVIDVGSGAGFPGIPLAVVRPEVVVRLVESRQKRSSFLRHVVRTIGLRNVSVWTGRAEDLPDHGDVVVGRAVAVGVLAGVAARSASGRLIVMRKCGVGDAPGWREVKRVPYVVGHDRHEVVRFEGVE